MNRFDSGSSADQLFGFFGAIVNTMQNWRDNIQATEAGYRDRIVHISLRSNEGGLNLAMPPAILKLLSERGLRAGQLLRDKFDFSSHIWARYRLTMCALQKYLGHVRDSWTGPLAQDNKGWDYIKGEEEASHYKAINLLQQRMRIGLETLVQISEQWTGDGADDQNFCKQAPRPEPILRNQPKF
jgi:hypothetical protein